mmetsp:Transcript_18518/g.45902  ORF Transcript_18518/g.45902 Transcript_18518/m.45902 type:complete len:161 (+) Transcript_18518:79-561(+)
MPELKRKSTPMPGTMKAFEYHHASNSPSSPYTRKHLHSHNRRRSSEIMNYIDYMIENGVPGPQQLGSREITKPYTRLSDTTSIATTAPLDDSMSSIDSCDPMEETDMFSPTNGTDKKEDESQAIAIWGWDSGLLLESKDDEIDIWDELYSSKCQLAATMR